MDSRDLGQWGERQAEKFLKRKGYNIVEKNFSCRYGEIDLIAKKGGFVAFIEVKLRKNAEHGAAMEFVTQAKQRRILTTAQMWLMKNECELQPRFDVIEVYAPRGEMTIRPDISHIENAFGM